MNSDNLKNKLRRFDSHIQPAGKRSETAPAPDHYQLMAEHLGGELVSNYAGVYCLVRTRYSRQYRHGALELAPDRSLRPLTRSAFTVQAQPGRVDPSSLLFLDTETTGLGGAGAVAFLVGCGSLVDNEFEVRQYLIPDYSDETAVLEAVLTELGEDKTVVTYNGAAFDLPLLRGRMIVNRVARDIPTADHIDLLHSARRLFRRRLADCTLTNVERELFDFHRDDDVPGYLIPSIYFDWLSERRLDNMVGVLEHNRLDIVSLWFLVNHIARAFESDGASLDAAEWSIFMAVSMSYSEVGTSRMSPCSMPRRSNGPAIWIRRFASGRVSANRMGGRPTGPIWNWLCTTSTRPGITTGLSVMPRSRRVSARMAPAIVPG
jgi:uncharacterized protein YprB with RNaseH-like and TPR domain